MGNWGKGLFRQFYYYQAFSINHCLILCFENIFFFFNNFCIQENSSQYLTAKHWSSTVPLRSKQCTITQKKCINIAHVTIIGHQINYIVDFTFTIGSNWYLYTPCHFESENDHLFGDCTTVGSQYTLNHVASHNIQSCWLLLLWGMCESRMRLASHSSVIHPVWLFWQLTTPSPPHQTSGR